MERPIAPGPPCEDREVRRGNRLMLRLPRGLRRLPPFLLLALCLGLAAVIGGAISRVRLGGFAVTVRNDSDSTLMDVSVSYAGETRTIADLPPNTWGMLWLCGVEYGNLSVRFSEREAGQCAIPTYVIPECTHAMEFIVLTIDDGKLENIAVEGNHRGLPFLRWRKPEYLTPQPVNSELYRSNHRWKNNYNTSGPASSSGTPDSDADTGEQAEE